ncbi:MAG: hypothetical protein J0H88_05085 [Sphingomonadales bacterium]|nr:hypothetical protein [Sphingomonadales bacterium]
MRRLALLLPLILAACDKDPSFDDRYDKAAKEIEARAKAMDADIGEAEKAADVADGAKAAPSAPGSKVEPGGKIPRTDPVPLPDGARPSTGPSSSGE